MVRGCQKKIIYLKNTDSEVFDEAYFIVSDKASDEKIEEYDMIEEANRILDECISYTEYGNKYTKIKSFLKVRIIPFIVGIIIGSMFILLIK